MGLPPTSQAYPSVLLSPTFRKAETEEQRQEAITHLVLPATSEERHAAFLPPVAEVLTKSAWIALLMAAPPARSQAGPPSSGPEGRCRTANGLSAHLIVSECFRSHAKHRPHDSPCTCRVISECPKCPELWPCISSGGKPQGGGVPGGAGLNTSPSKAGGADSIPELRSHVLKPKNQHIKQKQYCNKSNKDFFLILR